MRAPAYSSQVDEIFASATIADPYPFYRRLREERPVSQVGETGVHLVATRALIEDALAREEDFSAHLTGVLMRGAQGAPTVFALPDSPATRVIATADEPEHGVHRAAVQPRMVARQIAALEEPIWRWTRSAVGDWLARGGGDFVPIAEILPAQVVGELLGLPEDDISRFRVWAMMGGEILAGDVDEATLITLASETTKMHAYLGEHLDRALAATRADVGAPLLHSLARGIAAGQLDREEGIAIATVLFGAGGESTAALIGSAMRRLAEEPQLADQLRASPDLISAFVEEIARLHPPFNFHYRVARRDSELGGFEIRQGDRLMLLWASANRDAAVFDAPDELRLDRAHARDHLGFGRGAHFCIGAGVARLEARILCEELLARTSQISIAPDTQPVYAKSIFTRRLESLVLTAKPC
ncbi:MAG: cytochrome P450 [Deltaproteobacteria bacterium]